MESIVEFLDKHSKDMPDKAAVIANGNSVSYSLLNTYVNKYAGYLISCGVKHGDLVITRASQTVEYAVLYLAVHLAGAKIASLEKNTPHNEFISVAMKLKADCVIGEECEGCESIHIDSLNLLELDKKEFPVERLKFPKGTDSADILFTTGTTGTSKGVELSHRALVATAENLIRGCKYSDNTFLIVPGPLNHANAIRKLFTTIVNGSTIYILNGMSNIREFFEALDYQNGKVACCLPPAAIRTIFTLTKDKLSDYKEKIDFIESATAPLPEPDKIRLSKLLPYTRLYNNYGSSESASVCIYNYNEVRGKDGCIGKPTVNAEILIVDDQKKAIASSKDNVGLIACKGDMNMKGYCNDDVATSEVLVNGIVYTNDVGYIDDEGYVYIIGRKGDVINVGGIKIAPTEVESAALAIDGVDDCICVPIEDKITGYALKLLVVCNDKSVCSEKEIKEQLASMLEYTKIPKVVEKTEKIARTYNGKLDRKFYVNG
ncbi:class I adenylate-forming enzyme family protein [Butyrivibrio sp. MB2005]|uniref:class I adenylate-forming enzyme family protein n=1 Tax=Butyrivibrio sp. MB2005 TaxID=1280678 RepID=UPI00040DD014|nr:class I adenylate-forming enzyme family protein [Butyrivibrio sp. MB2005]